jgi:hypothetical protein
VLRDKFKTQRYTPSPVGNPETGWTPYSFWTMKPLAIVQDNTTIGATWTRYGYVLVPANSWAVGRLLYVEQQLQLTTLLVPPIPPTNVVEGFGINNAQTSQMASFANLTPPNSNSRKWFRRFFLRTSSEILVSHYFDWDSQPNAAIFDGNTNEFVATPAVGYPDFSLDFTLDFGMLTQGAAFTCQVQQVFAQAYIQAPYYLGRVRS